MFDSQENYPDQIVSWWISSWKVFENMIEYVYILTRSKCLDFQALTGKPFDMYNS